MLILPSRLRYPTSSVVVIAARLLAAGWLHGMHAEPRRSQITGRYMHDVWA